MPHFRKIVTLATIALLLAGGSLAVSKAPARKAAPAKPDDYPVKADATVEDIIRLCTLPENLVILGSSKDFPALKRQAVAIAKKSHVKFSLRDHNYDPHKGLVLGPDQGEWAGQYILRRYNNEADPANPALTPMISIEKSDAYPGLAKGYYIIVGGIYDTRAQANKALKKYQPASPTAYIKGTAIYYGCME